jgi:uncharacterized delta-60 repeat protein
MMRLYVVLAGLAISAAAPLAVRAHPGDLDPSFGSGGTAVAGNGSAAALVLQPDGKLVTAGLVSDQFVLLRFNGDGMPDASFGTAGRVMTSIAIGATALGGLVLQQDGKLVAAGGALVAIGDSDIALARYTASGALDPSFGTGGIVTGPALPGIQQAQGLAAQSDGKLVATATNGASDVIVVRYAADGTVDTAFGTGGIASVTVGMGVSVSTLVVQPDGMLVVAGSVVGTDSVAMLLRLDQDGVPDPGFGVGGVAMGPNQTSANDLLVEPTGELVAAAHSGKFSNNPAQGTHLAAIRWNSNGTLDGSFGSSGLASVSVLATSGATGVVREPNGGLIVAGYQIAPSGPMMTSSSFALARFDATGALDTNFGTNGVVRNPSSSSSLLFPSALIRQPDGEVVAAGSMGSPPNVLLARYEGSTFCGNGIVEPGEDCDDGNTASGDCCSPACEPPSGCRAAGKSLIVIKESGTAAKDTLVWKWTKGDATSLAELGQPTGTTSYSLCLYAGTTALASLVIPADAMKWSAIGTIGFKYSDPSGAAEGVRKVILKSGAAGKAKALLKGKGSPLPDNLLPVPALPLAVQLVNGDTNLCLGSTFDTGDVVKSSLTKFTAKTQ